MATTSATCPSCSKKYARVGGEEARKPVVLTCLCVFCKACALQEEAKAQQQQPASGGGGKKGKGKKTKKKGEEEKAEYIPTPCMSCGKHCKVPVNELKLDVAAMKAVDGGATREPTAPVCDMCEEEQATTFCGDCKSQQLLCDGCYTFAHKSAKKQGHASIPIQEHLAAAPARAAGDGSGAAGSAPPPMCQVHADEALKVYCNTCNILVCAMCAVMQHNGHIFTPVEQAVGKHRVTIEALVAEVVVTRQEAIAATNAIKIIRGELEGNRDAAIKLIDAGFTKLLCAITQRRDALKQLVNDAYTEKDDVLNKQITELEGIDSHSEIALKLVEATLAAATPIELLERKQLFVDGLMEFKEHGVSLKEGCGSTISTMVDPSFEQQATDILAVGWINKEDADPTASTAAGEGLATARVGKAAEFVVTAVEVGTGKQRSGGGDNLLIVLRQAIAADDGAAPSGSGGGGGGAAAAKPGSEKRKRGSEGSSNGKGRATKKSKTGATASSAAPNRSDVRIMDNGDGTYSCSYTPSEEAAEVGGRTWQLEVLLNGKPIVGSPFAIEVRPSANITNWAFGSIATGEYTLSEGGEVATKIANPNETGAIADGAGCSPMTSGVHFWELEVVKNEVNPPDSPGAWMFGVCRPGIDLDNGKNFHSRADTWVVYQDNDPYWALFCSTCAGTGITLDPKPKLPDGSRIGLLLDLDNGGTLTMHWEGKPCGTIAEGLVGPLLPCISSIWDGKVVKIHGGLAPPQ
eukprot:gene32577-biopygen31381